MLQGTTIIAVRKGQKTAIAGDGQVTFGNSVVMKHQARKVRRLYNDEVVAGFAGSVADAFTLFDKFETKLEQYRGNLMRAAVELAKEWRTDRVLQKLEAMLVVADREHLLIISGNGEVIEPDDGIVGIGSGGAYALAAARALCRFSQLEADEIARNAIEIAATICVYTNNQITLEEV